MNNRLKDAIAKAKSNNMPNDTIERSIKGQRGDVGNVNYEPILMKAMGLMGQQS